VSAAAEALLAELYSLGEEFLAIGAFEMLSIFAAFEKVFSSLQAVLALLLAQLGWQETCSLEEGLRRVHFGVGLWLSGDRLYLHGIDSPSSLEEVGIVPAVRVKALAAVRVIYEA